MSADGRKMLYISGEESLRQIKIRANRIGSFSQDLRFLCETNLETIEEVIRHTAPEIVIIDSIQTMYSETVSSAPGSVSQVRESTSAYSREWDYKRMREIADKVGALLMIDMAHPAGLIAAGLLENPVKWAHIVTSTTHKTLRGPRGGIILLGKDFPNP